MLENKLNVQDVVIERAHRVGRQKNAEPRPIVLKLLSYKDKELVLEKRKLLKDTSCYVSEDFSKETFEIRRRLWQKVREERRNGKYATVKYDQIVVRDFRSR